MAKPVSKQAAMVNTHDSFLMINHLYEGRCLAKHNDRVDFNNILPDNIDLPSTVFRLYEFITL